MDYFLGGCLGDYFLGRGLYVYKGYFRIGLEFMIL